MKLTKNTNKVRVEDKGFYRPEIYEKQADGTWVWTNGLNIKFTQQEFQGRLNHDDKKGYQIFDISEDE